MLQWFEIVWHFLTSAVKGKLRTRSKLSKVKYHAFWILRRMKLLSKLSFLTFVKKPFTFPVPVKGTIHVYSSAQYWTFKRGKRSFGTALSLYPFGANICCGGKDLAADKCAILLVCLPFVKILNNIFPEINSVNLQETLRILPLYIYTNPNCMCRWYNIANEWVSKIRSTKDNLFTPFNCKTLLLDDILLSLSLSIMLR